VRALVVFYSRYGNTARLAEEIAEGCRRVEGTEVAVRRAPELTPPEVVERDDRWFQNHRRLCERFEEATLEDLERADAILLGSSNRFGNMAAELKAFLDRAGPLWVRGALIGKVGGVFTTNSTAHSGKESTLLTMLVPLLHFGMIVVGVPPNVPETALAGSYYGACATSGPAADLPPTEDELAVARAHGAHVAEVAAQLLRGRNFAGVRI
jgi:NAD(P)H dehydrogenase (quinone)